MKMVFVVNKELEMGKGKIAAQCSHAAVMLTFGREYKNSRIKEWIMESPSQKKVVLKATQEEIDKLSGECEQQDIEYVLVYDAGRTQIKAGSLTVLGIGPDDEEKLDKLTGHLKLL